MQMFMLKLPMKQNISSSTQLHIKVNTDYAFLPCIVVKNLAVTALVSHSF